MHQLPPAPTKDELLEAARRVAQFRAIFMPPPPPPPRMRLEYTIKHAARLPARYLTPDHAALQALADSWHEGMPMPHVPGVRFAQTTKPTTSHHA